MDSGPGAARTDASNMKFTFRLSIATTSASIADTVLHEAQMAQGRSPRRRDRDVSDKGTGQGAVISPLLANIYLHYGPRAGDGTRPRAT
jgi:hypothetical protein